MAEPNKNKQLTLQCTFCSKSQNHVQRLVASSPSVAICNECVEKCSAIIKNASHLDTIGKYEVLKSETATTKEGFWLWRRIHDAFKEYIRCSFCHKRQIDVDSLIGRDSHYVCDECMGAISKMLAEEDL